MSLKKVIQMKTVKPSQRKSQATLTEKCTSVEQKAVAAPNLMLSSEIDQSTQNFLNIHFSQLKESYVDNSVRSRMMSSQNYQSQPELKRKNSYQLFRKSEKKSNQNSQTSQQSHPIFETNRIHNFLSHPNRQLDPRDQRVILPFDASELIFGDDLNSDENFDQLTSNVRDWLIDLAQITTSISFNQIRKGNLTDKQAKCYAAKNLLSNIKQLIEKLSTLTFQRKYNLITFINTQISAIFSQLLNKYPQTNGKGASKRVRSKINLIDNRSSDEFCFLLKNGIVFKYKEDGDYSAQIMGALNKMISFPNDPFDPKCEIYSSNYQIFNEILESLFEDSSTKTTRDIALDIENIYTEAKKKQNHRQQSVNNSQIYSAVEQIFNFVENTDSRVGEMKEKPLQKRYQIGQKISSDTQTFTKQEIQCENFKLYSSSIMRIITKWGVHLWEKLQNPEEHLYQRYDKFKTDRGKLINVEPKYRKKLLEYAYEEKQKLSLLFQTCRKQNAILQTLFAEQKSSGKYSKMDTKIGIFATKIREISSQYVFKILNAIIHSLLTVSKRASSQVESIKDRQLLSSLNLVTFNIGDLMRGKFSCSEKQFVKIMSVLEELSQKKSQILQIVRIKNRLDKNDNDVLINFFFNNKILCELQLSIHSKFNTKQKQYAHFNHFLYEICRSALSPLSQFSYILNEYDPLIKTFSKKKGFGPQLKKDTLNSKEKKRILQNKINEMRQLKAKLKIHSNIQLPFICSKCGNLSRVFNPDFYARTPKQSEMCNVCYDQMFLSENDTMKKKEHLISLLKNTHVQDVRLTFFENHLKLWDHHQFINKLKTYSQNQKLISFIPRRGYLINKHQKKPVLQRFVSVFDYSEGNLIFACKEDHQKIKIHLKVLISWEMSKRVKAFEQQLKNFYIFQLREVKSSIQNQSVHLKCINKKTCCAATIMEHNLIKDRQILKHSHQKLIQNAIEKRKNVLYFHQMKEAFNILQNIIRKKQTSKRIYHQAQAIHNIHAYKCQIDNIRVLSNFHNLVQLNLKGNKMLTSLQGIEYLYKLRILDCRDCNIQSIAELQNHRDLQYINLSRNSQLSSIDGISNCINLIQVNVSFTAVNSLQSLQYCKNLQILQCQQLHDIQTLKFIHSQHLIYLNIMNCSRITTIDLPIKSLKSIRAILFNDQKQIEQLIKSKEQMHQPMEIEIGDEMNILSSSDIGVVKALPTLMKKVISSIEKP